MTARLYLIRGLPGSGKSTLADQLLKGGAVDCVIEADHYFLDENGFYQFDVEKQLEAEADCLHKTVTALQDGARVAVANIFSRYVEALPYLHLVGAEDLQVLQCFGRWQNTHGMSDEVIAGLRARWEFF